MARATPEAISTIIDFLTLVLVCATDPVGLREGLCYVVRCEQSAFTRFEV